MNKASTKAATIGAAVGIVAVLLALSGAFAPVFAATATTTTAATTTTTTSTSTTSTIPGLSVGQVITIASTQGHFRVVGDSRNKTGPASGTVTLTVTGKFAGGYSLSITSGTLNVNGTAYAISSGSAESGHYAHHIVGQGATASGAFLMKATARGTFGGEYATMSFDLQSGTTEYVIALVGTIQS